MSSEKREPGPVEMAVRADLGDLAAEQKPATGMRRSLAEIALVLAEAVDDSRRVDARPVDRVAAARELRSTLAALVKEDDGDDDFGRIAAALSAAVRDSAGS